MVLITFRFKPFIAKQIIICTKLYLLVKPVLQHSINNPYNLNLTESLATLKELYAI